MGVGRQPDSGSVIAVTYGCDVLFDAETAVKVRAEISAKMGGECPCEAGKRCPLLPDGFAASLIPTPKWAARSGRLVELEQPSRTF